MARRFLFPLLILLSGCTTLPEPLATPPAGNVQLAEVRAEPGRFTGNPVRWGGTITATRNLKDETVIEVVARPLGSDGRPLLTDQSDGRFLAKLTGFYDPSVYAAGREITLRGVITGSQEQAIGEHSYLYIVVQVEHLHLWAARLPEPVYYDPWYSDPWYPWGWPYPHHGPYHRY